MHTSLFKNLILCAALLSAPLASADEFWLAGNVGNWNDIANWNNAVPAVGADVQARIRSGGTVTMNSIIDTGGEIDIRISDTASPLGTLIWNPGSGSGVQFIERIRLSDNVASFAQMNHLSGTIRLDNDWFHIARIGTATYNASGSAKILADDRISIAEGAGNQVTLGVANLSGNATLSVNNNNAESFIAVRNNADGFLNMTGNSVAESRYWRVGNDVGAQGTITMEDNAVFRAGYLNNGQISLGRSGEGNLTMTDNTTIDLAGDTSLRAGDNNNGVGNITMNGNSRVISTGNGNGHVVIGDDGTGVGNLTMNNTSGMTDLRRMWIGNGGDSSGTVTMNDSSFINLNRETPMLYLANSGTADGTLIMNDDSTISFRHLKADAEGSGGVATIIQNQNSKMTANGWVELGGGNLDTSTWTLNHSAQVIASGDQGSTHIGTRGNGTGILNLNDTSYFEQGASGGEFRVGSLDDANGIVNVNDSSFLYARNNLTLGVNNRSDGVVNQNSGTVQVNNTLYIGNDSGGVDTGEGTYNLNGGTLRTDRIEIRNGGTFEWGAATLTMREPNRGANGNGIEIEVVGNNGNLATSAGSILDLGDVYISNGLNFDKLDMNGRTLDLTAAGDTLEIWRYVNAFRPGGSNTSATYEIKLINSPNILGEFDNVTGPGPDFQYFGVYSSAQVATLGLTPANVPRNRGFIDYRADGAYFVFNVAGQVPEPSTGIFLLFGTMLLRGVSVMRRNRRILKSYTS